MENKTTNDVYTTTGFTVSTTKDFLSTTTEFSQTSTTATPSTTTEFCSTSTTTNPTSTTTEYPTTTTLGSTTSTTTKDVVTDYPTTTTTTSQPTTIDYNTTTTKDVSDQTETCLPVKIYAGEYIELKDYFDMDELQVSSIAIVGNSVRQVGTQLFGHIGGVSIIEYEYHGKMHTDTIFVMDNHIIGNGNFGSFITCKDGTIVVEVTDTTKSFFKKVITWIGRLFGVCKKQFAFTIEPNENNIKTLNRILNILTFNKNKMQNY